MAVDFSTALPVGYTPATAASKSTADYQSFLKLLVAQMKNQDPSNPMDATQYVAQLATFSQVVEAVKVTSSGLVAVLEGGGEMASGAGITIKAAEA